MGEAADVLLNGEACEWCGTWFDEGQPYILTIPVDGALYVGLSQSGIWGKDAQALGVPRRCMSCWSSYQRTEPRSTTIHDLKTINPHFDAAWEGVKTFECRKNDRDFHTDDYLILWEYNASKREGLGYTGRWMLARVSYAYYIDASGTNCTPEQYAILSLVVMSKSQGHGLDPVDRAALTHQEALACAQEHMKREAAI